MKQRNKRITSYFILFSLILILGVVYAILQANLQINGTAKITQNTWDVHFENIQVTTGSVSIGTGDNAAVIDPNNDCKVDFSVTLSLPGDFYEFTVDVKNEGTIDAMIGALNKSLKVNNVAIETVPEYLNYTVTYDDGGEILEKHLLEKNSFVTYKVRVEFKTDIDEEDLPDATTISMSVEPTFIQADDTAINKPPYYACTYNGELVQGAEYVNGQYTYRYMQEMGYSSWTNITNDGWGVTLTDKDSTDPVTTRLCTTINDKPIVSMSYMFFNSKTASIDTSSFDTSKITNMAGMFYSAGKNVTSFIIEGLSNWNTSNVTNMGSLFQYAGQNATTWTIGDISNWDVSNVTVMGGLFANAGQNATTWSIGDLSKWNTSNVTNMNGMFAYAGQNVTTWSIGDLSNWNTSNVTHMNGMFAYAGQNATTWSIGDLSNWDTAKVTNMSGMFQYAGQNATTWNSIGSLKVYASNILGMFGNCPNAKATLKIYNNPNTYTDAFNNAATVSGSGITVDYTSSVTDIDAIIATKSSNSNVVKGSLFTP